MPDYIPSGDTDFNSWVSNFMAALGVRRGPLGVTDPEFNALTAAHATWEAAFAQHTQAQTQAATASQTKRGARESFEDSLRLAVKRIQTHPAIQDADRVALGIGLVTATRTPAAAPTTRPVAQVDTSQRLRHTISFADETTPNRRTKPDGVRGCEIRVKVGDPAPTDPSELSFLALDTSTPYVAEYGGADAGKTAHYMLRWVNTREEKGPWSQTVSATIPA
jgi:hypothetical protein